MLLVSTNQLAELINEKFGSKEYPDVTGKQIYDWTRSRPIEVQRKIGKVNYYNLQDLYFVIEDLKKRNFFKDECLSLITNLLEKFDRNQSTEIYLFDCISKDDGFDFGQPQVSEAVESICSCSGTDNCYDVDNIQTMVDLWDEDNDDEWDEDDDDEWDEDDEDVKSRIFDEVGAILTSRNITMMPANHFDLLWKRLDVDNIQNMVDFFHETVRVTGPTNLTKILNDYLFETSKKEMQIFDMIPVDQLTDDERLEVEVSSYLKNNEPILVSGIYYDGVYNVVLHGTDRKPHQFNRIHSFGPGVSVDEQEETKKTINAFLSQLGIGMQF